jgi:hypothetical protein
VRKIYSPTNGSDVTSTVQSYLQEGGAPVTAFLYSFQCQDFWGYNPYGVYAAFCYTDFEANLGITYAQMGPVGSTALTAAFFGPQGPPALPIVFKADNIAFDKLSYKIGLDDNPVEVNWAMNPGWSYSAQEYSGGTTIGWSNPSAASYPTNLTLKQALTMGAFTECPFWIHEAIFTDFPDRGGTFLGTSLMFRGFIRKTSSSFSTLKISLASLMDVFQSVQIPAQTITPNNRSLPYIPLAVSPYNDNGLFSHYSAPAFPAPTVLQIDTTYGIPLNALQDSWINWTPAAFAGYVPYRSGFPTAPSWRIQGNTAGAGTIEIYLYEPYIFPGNYGGFNIWAQQNTTGGPAAGFLYLPPPEFSA